MAQWRIDCHRGPLRCALLQADGGNFAPPPDRVSASPPDALQAVRARFTTNDVPSAPVIPRGTSIIYDAPANRPDPQFLFAEYAPNVPPSMSVYRDGVLVMTVRAANFEGIVGGATVDMSRFPPPTVVPLVAAGPAARAVPPAPRANGGAYAVDMHFDRPGPGVVSGTTTLNGQPFPHCPVYLLTEHTKQVVARGASDANAEYYFSGLKVEPLLVLGEAADQQYNHVVFARVTPVIP